MKVDTAALRMVRRGMDIVVVMVMRSRMCVVWLVIGLPSIAGRVVVAVMVTGGKGDDRSRGQEDSSQGTKVHFGCIMRTRRRGVKGFLTGFYDRAGWSLRGLMRKCVEVQGASLFALLVPLGRRSGVLLSIVP